MKALTIKDIERIVHRDENRMMEAGRGILDIFTLCKEAGLPEPEYDFVQNFVCLTIRFKTPLRPYVSVGGELNGRLNGRLNPTQQTVYDSIVGNPGIKAKDISAEHKIQIDTLYKVIRALTEMNLIERRGSRKTGGYYPLVTK
jgi:ATP-dependent DNA helicase RecG